MSLLKRSLMATLISVLAFESGMFVFVAAIPVFYLFVVYGRKEGWTAAFLSLLLMIAALLYGEGVNVLYFGYFIFVGIILGEGFVRRADLFQMAGLAIVMPWVTLISAFVVLQFGLGMSIISDLNVYFSQTVDQMLKMKDAMTALSAQQLAYVQNNVSEIAKFMLWTTPSSILLFFAFVVSLTIFVTRSLTRKIGAFTHFGNIAAKKFPFWPVWATIAFGALYFSDTYVLHNIVLKYFAINGLICFAGLYFIQGLFVVSFWLKKGRSPIFRFFVYGLIVMFLQIMSVVIIGLGLSDQWFEFRKRVAQD